MARVALILAGVGLLGGASVFAVWLQMGPSGNFMIDLAVFRAAGYAVIHGGELYGAGFGTGLQYRLPFVYPPVAAVLLAPTALLPRIVADWAWDLGSVAVLVWCARAAFGASFLRLHATKLLGLGILAIATLFTAPIEDHLALGQVGIFLMALCLVDCTTRQMPWPRGVLVGIATAGKLVPAIFVVYFLISKRKRAAATALATALGLTVLGAVMAPGPSFHYWTHVVFAIGKTDNAAYFTNQSILGVDLRIVSPHAQIVAWVGAAAVISWIGLHRARKASIRGDELTGVVLAGLTGVLVSPISWIHHLVWLIPAVGIILSDARHWSRIAGAGALWGLLVFRLPYVGVRLGSSNAPWVVAELLRDSYALVCIVLILILPIGDQARADVPLLTSIPDPPQSLISPGD
ncbi:MAG: glycosyltransferase 87 family protein [Acidimicrobiales bacterium]